MNMIKLMFVFEIFVLFICGSCHEKTISNPLGLREFKKYPQEFLEDGFLDVPKLITKYGYPVEVHEVQTKDGYLITMHRIPGMKVNSKEKGVGTPVMVMHGLHGSSSNWIINGPKSGLGYLLANEGYDVWLSNARGNYYSRKHVSLKPDDDDEFWLFSWHEIGYYDLPACIDYILSTTGREKLQYIGHSQGSTAFFVMASMMPEYNEKISLMQSLAPVAYLSNLKWPLVKLVAPMHQTLEIILKFFGSYEFRIRKGLSRIFANHFCNKDSMMLPMCAGFIFLIGGGYNQYQLNTTLLPVYIGHAPAGASFRQHIHYAQVYISKRFRQYDHGKKMNKMFYGKPSPPEYNLKNITAPVALYFADNDLLAVEEDVNILSKKLPNLVVKIRVPSREFSHLDFILGIDVKEILYDFMLKIMMNYL